MKKPTIPKLATALAIPGGLLIAGVWIVLWACRCRHLRLHPMIGPDGQVIYVCYNCGDEVEAVS